MKNNNMRQNTIITTCVCLIPVILGIVLYSRLPDVIVTHWDGNGNPNGWQSKFVGAIVFPGTLVIVNLIFPILLKIDPQHKNTDGKVQRLLQWIIPLVSVFCSAVTLAAALGKAINVAMLAPMFLGFVFILIGNYLPKMGQSYTVGIKIPWTLHDEENWNKTHRMAGFLWVVGGICMMLAGAVEQIRMLVFVIMAILIIVPIGYSYFLYQKKQS